MQRALDFLKNHAEIAFATSEGNRPHIRIFQIMKMEDTTLFFATSPEKEVYRDDLPLINSRTIAIRKDISEVLLHFINVKSY